MRFLLTFGFSLLKKGIRDAWIITETLVSILSFCLSVATISNRIDIHPELTGVELALSILMLGLSLLDVIFDFTPRWQQYYRNAKAWLANYRQGILTTQSQCQGQNEQTQAESSQNDENMREMQIIGEQEMENIEVEKQEEQEMENVRREEQREQEMENVQREEQREQEIENVGREEQGQQEIQNVIEEEQREHVRNDATRHNRQQLKPHEVFQKFSDPVRSIVSEVLIYSLLIISLFQFVTGKGYDPSMQSNALI